MSTDYSPRRCPTCFAVLPDTQPQCLDPECVRDTTERSLNDLPVGTVLGDQFRIGRVLGRGGFGITYLAWDERLENRRAIKECFPLGFVRRSNDRTSVLPINEEKRSQFQGIRDKYLKEARVLAQFHDQPGIVSVLSILEDNATAYLVMEFLHGRTLKVYLEEQPGGRLPFESAAQLLRPAMEALAAVHDRNWLHRDVAPDNIFITHRGHVKLLDFGAARQAAGQEHSKSLHVVLKPGYAPQEQYSARGQQGPWTDVYALAGTFYTMLTGLTPPAALDRLEEDDLQPPSALQIPVPASAEAALMAGLAVNRTNRTRSVAEFADGILSALAQQAPRVSWQPSAAPPPMDVPAPPLDEPQPLFQSEPAADVGPPEEVAPPEEYDSPGEHGSSFDVSPDVEEQPPFEPLHQPEEPSDRVDVPRVVSSVQPVSSTPSVVQPPPRPPGKGQRPKPGKSEPPKSEWDLSVGPSAPEPPPARGRGRVILGIAAAMLVLALAGVLVSQRSRRGYTATLVIEATPWATVEQVRDASGQVQPLPDPPATPLSIPVGPGTYTVVLSGPPPAREHREVTVSVTTADSVQRASTTFEEIQAEDYFRRQLEAASGSQGGGQ